MIFLMSELFKTIEKLHNLELYEDLSLLSELHLPNEPSKIFTNDNELDDDQRGFFLCCLANACAELDNTSRALRYYEMALVYLGNICQHKLKNRYESLLNIAQIRYQMHKIFLQNKQEEEALHCLESIPRTELTPKVLLAMARLCHQLAKPPSQCTRSLFNKRTDIPNSRIVNYFKAIVKEVPEAIYCQSYLLAVGAVKPSQQSPPTNISKTRGSPSSEMKDFIGQFSEVSRIWSEAKQLQAKKQYIEAAKLLDNPLGRLNLRFLLEQASFYRIAGDQQKALACYQQAHLLDSTNAEGMDTFASLLGTNSNTQQTQRELDLLAHKMVHSNPRRAEAFIVYGWAARQSHRMAEARQFAQRAEQLAKRRGKQRCEALLLKAQLLFDTKRHYKEMEIILADALHNDCTNTAVYSLYIQIFMAQKRFGEAQRMSKTSLRFSGTEQAVLTLEKMVQDGHSLSLELILLLSRLYDRQHKYDKAIVLLNRFKESYGDARIHRELGDLLSKTNRPKEALGEYGLAMNANTPDTIAKEKMIALMGDFTTPQNIANTTFKNSSVCVSSNNITTNVTNTTSSPSNRAIRVPPPPPPVTRVTRRTVVNQHEQLRRLRGMGTFSTTGSSESGPRAQFRRIAAVRGLNNGRNIIGGEPLSPLSRPLQFQDDNSDEDISSSRGESSNDESQISFGVTEQQHQQSNNNNNSSSSSSILEQARGNVNNLSFSLNGDNIFRNSDEQRYLGNNEIIEEGREGEESSSLLTLRNIDSTNGTNNNTQQINSSSFRLIEDTFMPLIADEPLLEEIITDNQDDE
ncbi:hypothetical protein Mgra_00004151 [Meloidogyne graminicola]|uniref:Uncharacterized protein n=1 Tax=Meloidogyne graminicola TaxID=189291 RepID=A0A8S9ZSY6_9BILA|nr:hypothetical protein Mgra_00004151 [Meloidogyne graminicola]